MTDAIGAIDAIDAINANDAIYAIDMILIAMVRKGNSKCKIMTF